MQVPESVRAYVDQGGIRRAVRELLALGDTDLLEGLEWSELDRFYRAQLAARQLSLEWASFGLSAWAAVWGGLLEHWTALSPDEQTAGDYEAGLGPASLLDTHDGSLWFGRIFTMSSWTLYATVTAVPSQGLKLKVSCNAGKREVSFRDMVAELDEIDNWVSIAIASLDAADFDPAELRTAARRAVEIADAQVAASARKVQTPSPSRPC